MVPCCNVGSRKRQRGAILISSMLPAISAACSACSAIRPVLYLLTFTLGLAYRPGLPSADLVGWWLPAVLVLAFVMLTEATEPLPVVLGLHGLVFLIGALVCHGELARSRPATQHLTE